MKKKGDRWKIILQISFPRRHLVVTVRLYIPDIIQAAIVET